VSAAAGQRRRTPTQTRGRERFETIVEAAASLIGEVGPDALTLTDVAARAGCAIGSVYQYFGGKAQLVDAVVERLAERFAPIASRIVAKARAASLADYVSTVLRAIVAFWDEYPAFISLMERLRRQMPSPQREMHAGLLHVLRTAMPLLGEEEREVVARVTIELIKAALHTLAATPKRHRATVLREFEEAISLYLSSRKRRS
jgi:AcrR family transcriptional regulator